MLLSVNALQDIFDKDILEASTYSTREGDYIRLINNHPDKATTPALYPNVSTYRLHLNKFANVKSNRIEYKEGIATGNKKTDLYLDYVSKEEGPSIPLPSLEEF